MKDIKKESLLELSKTNLKNSILILIIRLSLNIFLFLLIALYIYSSSGYTFPKNSFFNIILYSITAARHNNQQLLLTILFILIISSFFMFIPIKFGIYLWFSKIRKGTHPDLSIIFHYYQNIESSLKIIIFQIILLIKSFFNLILYLGPSLGIFIYSCSKLNNNDIQIQFFLRILILISAVTTLLGGFLFTKSQILQIFTKFIFITYRFPHILLSLRSSNFLIRINQTLLKQFIISFYYSIFAILLLFPIPFLISHFYVSLNKLIQEIIYKQNQGLTTIPLNEKVIDINTELFRF